MTERQKAIKKLDRTFSLFVRQRDTENGYGKCCSCQKFVTYSNMDAGHFISRRWLSTRWREDNVHGQCSACNRFDEGNSAGYALFMLDKYGLEHVKYLKALSKEQAAFTVTEINLLINDYKKRLKNA